MTCIPSETDWGSFNWATAPQETKDRRELAELYAWETLNRLVAGAISICPVQLRPARFGHRAGITWSPVWAYGPLNPYIGEDGGWRNLACDCGRKELRFPFTITAVEYVEIDGAALDPSAYRVDDGNVLVRQDGGVWPAHQNMSAPAGEAGTFVVSAFTGSAPNKLDRFAAGVLAREFLKLITGDAACRLPKNMTTYTRQGTTIVMDPSVKAGTATGIPEVDNIILMRNPHRLTQQSRVYSPDTIDSVRSTTFRAPVNTIPAPVAPELGTLVPDPANPGFYITRES